MTSIKSIKDLFDCLDEGFNTSYAFVPIEEYIAILSPRPDGRDKIAKELTELWGFLPSMVELANGKVVPIRG